MLSTMAKVCAGIGSKPMLPKPVNGVAIVVGEAAQRRRNVLETEHRLIARVAPGLVGQEVGDSMVGLGAIGAVDRAMDRGADVVIELIVGTFLCLIGACAEDLYDLEGCAFEDDVGGREGGDIATGAGEGHPRCGHVFDLGSD